MSFLVPLTIFLSAFLLFLVQPMMGRYVLPWFGGGPAVWSVCLLFFQTALLAGYAYSHWIASRKPRTQGAVHLALLGLSLVFLPIHPNAALWKPLTSGDPSGRILLLLLATVGGPYLLLSATGPLLQRWFTWGDAARSPWRLYALSNLGSFLALLSYPFAVEPFFRLDVQVWAWSGLYVAFVACCGVAAWRFRAVAEEPAAAASVSEDAAPSALTILFWLALSTTGSVLLVSTTNQISQEIAVNPFLWVAPLAIYLLTFVLTFESDRFYKRGTFAVAAGILAPLGCMVPSLEGAITLRTQLLLYLGALFVTCILCNGELARSRPSPRYLTKFYLAIAGGGALGGAFVALIAPRIFTEFLEFPIGLGAACLLGFVGWMRTGALREWTRGNLALRIPLMALLLGGATGIAAAVVNNQAALASARNFYGILRVIERTDQNGAFRELRHGRTRHGLQYQAAAKRDWPTTYYGPLSGVATALAWLDQPNRRIAVIGLGAGTLAIYGRPGDSMRFYEINPDVEAFARQWFTYLADSKATTEVALGDARIELERELAAGRARDYDLIAVDAFSSDAIPFHLLTAECADVYASRLKPGGLLLLHISNRVLNLEPVARGMAAHLGWKAVLLLSGDDPETGESSSRWVLLTSNDDFLRRSGLNVLASPWTRRAPLAWTDDFVSLWHVLNF